MKALESVCAARELHHRLVHEPGLSQRQKEKLAREIAGQLFVAEIDRTLPNESRLLFDLLRTNAHHATLPQKDGRPFTDMSTQYEELEEALRLTG